MWTLVSNWLGGWPWWIWPLIGAAIVIPLLQYIAPIWSLLPSWAKTAIIAVSSLFVAWWAGRNKGKRDADEARKQADAKAEQRREAKNVEIQKLDPKTRDDRLSQWNRD